jgi:NAD(P)-dependent dehydrogenase (short-subunit alcohol dehydrogenase family)
MSNRSDPPPGRPSTERVALVTGVTSGVGRVLADTYIQAGFWVIGMGRREDLGADWAAGSERALFVTGDVTQSSDCEASVQTAVRTFGRLDVLVNNAGGVGDRPVVDSRDITDREWAAVVDTNLTGTFFCSRAALRVMAERREGLILNISSINAEIGIAGMCAYNAAKAGVVQLTKTLAVEYGPFGVRVNAALLGGVTTAALHDVKLAQGSPSPGHRRSLRLDAAAVARLIVALSEPDAGVLNGAIVAIDNAATAGALANAALTMATT